jgi:hypothetical protein
MDTVIESSDMVQTQGWVGSVGRWRARRYLPAMEGRVGRQTDYFKAGKSTVVAGDLCNPPCVGIDARFSWALSSQRQIILDLTKLWLSPWSALKDWIPAPRRDGLAVKGGDKAQGPLDLNPWPVTLQNQCRRHRMNHGGS